MNNTLEAYERSKELAPMFNTWLSAYTAPVISRVMMRYTEIVSDDHTMHLLKELHTREQEEQKDTLRSFQVILQRAEEGTLDPYTDSSIEAIHLHCLTHSKSYRDILYDMWIRDY